eukprot:SAG11_NODE_38013_length_254_cov_0.670968_1_plen_77_part_01
MPRYLGTAWYVYACGRGRAILILVYIILYMRCAAAGRAAAAGPQPAQVAHDGLDHVVAIVYCARAIRWLSHDLSPPT